MYTRRSFVLPARSGFLMASALSVFLSVCLASESCFSESQVEPYSFEFGDDQVVGFDHQVGGTGHTGSSDVVQKLKGDEARILKPLPSGARAKSEISFYRKTLDTPFQQFLPEFFGVVKKHGESTEWLHLEDLTASMKKPCVADVKIGKLTWGPDASIAKQKRDIKSYPLQSTIGFRFVGLKVYSRDTNEWNVIDKSFGKSLAHNNVSLGWETFFDSGYNSTVKAAIHNSFVDQVKEILEFQKHQEIYRVFSSSLLFLYDAADVASPAGKVRMIDFGHAFEIEDDDEDRHDSSYLFGIENMLKSLESFEP